MAILTDDRGFSLVEVLIAMMVLAFGMLGVAALQTTAITGNTVARTGTEAVQLAQEMVELVRTNAGNTPAIYNGLDTSAGCGTLSSPASGDCTLWTNRLANSNLKNAVGTVTVTQDQIIEYSATVKVKLSWFEDYNREVAFTTVLETWGS